MVKQKQETWFSWLAAKVGRPPAKKVSYMPQKLSTPSTLLEQLYDDFPFDTGLLTSTGRSQLEEREGLDIFEEMSRDPQVVAAYALKRNAIVSGRWVVDPASDSPEDQKIAAFVNWNLKTLLGDTGLGLKPITTAFLYGRSICEIIWEEVLNGEYAGNYKMCKLKPKNPGAIGFTMDEFNNMQTVNVTNLRGERIQVNPTKVVHYAWNGEFDNPYGKPDLCSVYPWWWAKKTFYKYALIYGDKYAAPIPNFKIDRKLSADEETKLKEAATNFHISNYFMTPKGVELELLQSSGTGGNYYIQAINSLCDTQIARSILAQTLATNENSKTGTFAQAEVHQDTLKDILEEIRNEVENTVVQEQVIKPIVDVNFPNVADYPKFRFDPFDAEFLKSVADAIATMCNIQDDFGNRLVDPKEPWVRERAKLPIRDTKEFPFLTKMPEWKLPKENPKLPGKPNGNGNGNGSKPKPKSMAELGPLLPVGTGEYENEPE
jgi:phage gp29-like protein